MIFLIYTLIVIPFISDEPVILEWFCQRNLPYALILGLTILRSNFIGYKKINIKPLIFSLMILAFYIILTQNGVFLWQKFFSRLDRIEFSKYFVSTIFIFFGLSNLSFYLYHKLKYKRKGSRLYRAVEILTGISWVFYPILKVKAWYGVKISVVIVLIILGIYGFYSAYVKILERKISHKQLIIFPPE